MRIAIRAARLAFLIACVATCGKVNGLPNGQGPGGDSGANCPTCDPCVVMGLESTTVSGVVYDPAGNHPVFAVLVYVPAAPLEPLPEGVVCDRCGGSPLVSGSPIVSTLTDADGTFTLSNVPPGDDVPVVLQIGKWRKSITVPHVSACADTSMTDPAIMRLPANRSEGDVPRIAVATGGCDPFECLLRKVGIDDSEFTDDTADGRVQVFQGAAGASMSAQTTSAQILWSSRQELLRYDVVINACECDEHPEEKPQEAIDNLVAYANAGGRLISTHRQYFWLANSPWSATGDYAADRDWDDSTQDERVDTSFSLGQGFASWLSAVGASPTTGQVAIGRPRSNLNRVNAPALAWIEGNHAVSGAVPILALTFHTPLNASHDMECGKVLYADFESAPRDHGPLAVTLGTFPTECDPGPMTPQEKALEFLLFEQSSCVSHPPSRVMGDDMQ